MPPLSSGPGGRDDQRNRCARCVVQVSQRTVASEAGKRSLVVALEREIFSRLSPASALFGAFIVHSFRVAFTGGLSQPDDEYAKECSNEKCYQEPDYRHSCPRARPLARIVVVLVDAEPAFGNHLARLGGNCVTQRTDIKPVSLGSHL